MKNEMICIACPLGCVMTAEYAAAGGAIGDTLKVSGSGCPRGIVYAKNEITDPKRTITTTLKVKGGGTVSVKTSAPVPKAEIFAVLGRLKGVEIAPPVRIGQVLAKAVSPGSDMIATQDLQ